MKKPIEDVSIKEVCDNLRAIEEERFDDITLNTATLKYHLPQYYFKFIRRIDRRISKRLKNEDTRREIS